MNVQELIDAGVGLANSECGTCRICGAVGPIRLGLCGMGCSPKVMSDQNRSECKAFCGMAYGEMVRGTALYELWTNEEGYSDGCGDSNRVWCSMSCKATKLPPIAAPVDPPSHPERKAGQRWRCGTGSKPGTIGMMTTFDFTIGERDRNGEALAIVDIDGHNHKFAHDYWWSPDSGIAMTLLSLAPKAAEPAPFDPDEADEKQYNAKLAREQCGQAPVVPAKYEACRRYQVGFDGCHVCGMPEEAHDKPAVVAPARCDGCGISMPGPALPGRYCSVACEGPGRPGAREERILAGNKPKPAKCPYSAVTGERHIVCSGANLRRWRGKYEVNMCEAHYLNFESIINTDGLTNVLSNPAVPELLSKPRMAVDWTWETLPDGSR